MLRRGAKVGDLELEVGDIVALAGSADDDADEGGLQFAQLQALWQTAAKAKMMQVTDCCFCPQLLLLLMLISSDWQWHCAYGCGKVFVIEHREMTMTAHADFYIDCAGAPFCEGC